MVQTTSKKNKTSHILSILIAQDGLSFCVLNEANHQIENYFSKDFEDSSSPEKLLVELQNAFKIHLVEEIQQKNIKVKLIHANNLYNLVPKAYFSENNLADYLKFNIKILQTDFMAFDELKTMETNCVYVPYANINNFIFEKFGEFGFSHSATLFTDFCLLDGKNKEKEQLVYLNVRKTTFDICVIKSGQLQLMNSFEYFTSQDFIYYVLFCLEQLQLNTEEVQIELVGRIKETDEIYDYLYTYIKHISFLDTSRLANKFPNLAEKAINPKENLLLLSNFL